MLTGYIQAAMRHAHYEIIDDPKPYYGSTAGMPTRQARVHAPRDAILLMP